MGSGLCINIPLHNTERLCVILKDQAPSRKPMHFFEQRTRSKSLGFHPVRDADSQGLWTSI